MLITLKAHTTDDDVEAISKKISDIGCKVVILRHRPKIILEITGSMADSAKENIGAMPRVESVVDVSKPYKLVSREYKKSDTIIHVENIVIGGKGIVIIAGPCSVESKEKLWDVAREVKSAGAHMLRGGAFKPRSSPYSFQGLGEKGLIYLWEAKKAFGLPIVTEVMNPHQVDIVAKYADILQIGARNMHNFDLLKEAGRTNKVILLKRGLAATIEELLMAAEYLMANGNNKIILCERGIRTFEPLTRFTLDLSAIPAIKHLSHLPVIVDPSHGVGVREYIPAMAKAAIAAGADGLIIEVHPQPEAAYSDGKQSLFPEQFNQLMKELQAIAVSIGREMNK